MDNARRLAVRVDDAYTNTWTRLSSSVVWTSAKGVDIDCGHVVFCSSFVLAYILLIIALVFSFQTQVMPPPPITCHEGSNPSEQVNKPVFKFNIPGETGWFASPAVVDLDNDGKKEIVIAQYSLFVYNSSGALLSSASGTGRVYAPHVIADIDNDGVKEIVVGRGSSVVAYEYSGSLTQKWASYTPVPGEIPEVRGLAGGDLDADGTIEIVATTTQTLPSAQGGSQVYVFSHTGQTYQPIGGHSPAWPRYNSLSGIGNDRDFNCYGHNGYGAYGLNVAIGDVDGLPGLEIAATYDNHHLQLFRNDGVAINSSPYFRRRDSGTCYDSRMTWGAFIRYEEESVEHDHYHLHVNEWPGPSTHNWLQWTSSPPAIIDIDGDGKNEVIGIPNIEKSPPVYDAVYDEDHSAKRKKGWEEMPHGTTPLKVSGWYPPGGVPSPSFADVIHDERLEILSPMNDGHVYCFGMDGIKLWSFDIRTYADPLLFASEMMVADLNQDGRPEIIFTTWGIPGHKTPGSIIILDGAGNLLSRTSLPHPGYNGNGNGASAPPTIADIDGDGQLEILVQTYDHGVDVFTVPDSSTNCMIWTDSRGSLLRQGSNSFKGYVSHENGPFLPGPSGWGVFGGICALMGFVGIAGCLFYGTVSGHNKSNINRPAPVNNVSSPQQKIPEARAKPPPQPPKPVTSVAPPVRPKPKPVPRV